MLWCFKATALFFLFAPHCFALPTLHNEHAHTIPKRLGGQWFHESDHSVHKLFRRGPTDGTVYAPVGSPEWAAGYPRGPDEVGDNLPQEWIDALDAAIAAGTIPNLPPSDGTGRYPNGLNPASPEVCSSTAACRGDDDIWDGPDGVFWSSFDDGPQTATALLNEFLAENDESTTHFMIGSNILYFPDIFLQSFDADHDIAVHTWSHRQTSSLSNEEILGEFGWTMQLIHNSTGGRVPRYWRPPYGDSDNRVRAIAKEIFGLTTVIWNHDTADWRQDNPAPIVAAMNEFLSLPKSPGLVVLNHEIHEFTIQGFIESYPAIRGNGWEFKSLALIGEEDNIESYQNSAGSLDEVIPAGVLVESITTSTTSSTSETPTTTETATETATPTAIATPIVTSNGAGKNTLDITATLLGLAGLLLLTI